MKNYYRYLIMLVSLLVLMAITACSSDSTSDGEKGKGDGVDDDNTLVIAQSADLTSMDPQNSLSTNAERIMRNMYSRLFYRDKNMEIKPDAVESYEQVDDETWVFTLKEGITFHNGDPLTAEDVKFSLERVMTDQTLKEYPYFTQLKEVNVVDELKVEIVTDGPMPTLFNVLAKSGADIIPKNYFEKVGVEGFQKNPIGSGPYKYVDWKPDDRVILEPYEDYFGGSNQQWDQVVVRAITESSTRVGELLTGGVDIATDIPPNEWERVSGKEGVDLVGGDTTRVMLLVTRTTEGYVTSDPKVREAIDLAINEQTIVDSVLQGTGVPVRSRVPTEIFGSNPDLYDAYVYDPERAKELLAEAGYEDGVKITLTAPKGRYMLDGEVAQLVASMLGEVGITVNLQLLESSAFLDVYNSNSNEELIMIGLADGLFDASYSLVHYTKDRAEGQTDYYNEEVEQLYHDAGRNLDDEERIEQYQKIQAIVAEERPHIFLYQEGVNYGVSQDINFAPRLDEGFLYDDITRK